MFALFFVNFFAIIIVRFALIFVTYNFIGKEDPILKITKEFIQNPNTDYKDIYCVLLKAWDITNRYHLSKLHVFDHPLFIKDKDIEKFQIYSLNSTNYFKNIKMIYLLFGTAIKELNIKI